ncbi:AAA family ATPase [Rhodococcus sp. IEGM 1354]|uniref:ATP-dependent nuclease n=1 Tax=Rhodococcus sp. IEGM 1354 TaxID=3047088 RepID=UPI0024B6967D|nr:AAA family ATPase [Rhodococcus sp. IEGM 1354]MDI9932375.1 AAA family ATPase [Rhodococcus sp. IEGM 1354]
MISRIRLISYKGFNDFTIRFASTSLLIGPNNAGKSTAIGALRLCAALLHHAKRRKPNETRFDQRRDRSVFVYPISITPVKFFDENIRHEFQPIETRIELHFKNKSALYVVWPEDEAGYFYLEHIPGAQPPSLAVARRDYSTIGVVQTLNPLEHQESVLSELHVRENLGTRLASKHFRNQLYQVDAESETEFAELKRYLVDRTPEIASLDLAVTHADARQLDLYFRENNSKVEKEIYWAGDGLQIWLQLLFHIWRHEKVQTLILDEPDVYLHPDLQRRLVSLLEDLGSQVILATHAPEMLAEANKESVILIDRNRRTSKRITDSSALSEINDSLGSGFNLRLAKALQSKVALFVEGKDMKILSNLAKKLDAKKLGNERGVTVVPMGGSSKSDLAKSFGWLNRTVLDSSVQVYVALDRDFMSDNEVAIILEGFAKEDVRAHVWQRNEIESYLISVPTISRISGIEIETIHLFLDETTSELREKTFGQFLSAFEARARGSGKNIVTLHTEVTAFFNENWQSTQWRLERSPGKEVLAGINRRIQSNGGTAVSPRSLSSSIYRREIPDELRDFLLEIESLLT